MSSGNCICHDFYRYDTLPIIDVDFDRGEEGLYYPGDTVHVAVKVKAENHNEVISMYLTLAARERTSWLHWGRSKGTYRPVLSGRLELYDNKGLKGAMLPTATHEFKFSFRLPETSPPSFEPMLDKGIEYRIEIAIRRGKKLFPMDFLWRFRVDNMSKFAIINPCYLSPYESKVLSGKGFFSGDPVQMTVSCPRLLYLRGEQIPLKIELTNNSNYWMRTLEVRLMQLFHFHSHPELPCDNIHLCDVSASQRRDEEVEIGVSKKDINLQPNTTATYSQMFLLPSSLPISFATELTSIQYEVRVNVGRFWENAFKKDVVIPVYIGNEELPKNDETVEKEDISPEDQP